MQSLEPGPIVRADVWERLSNRVRGATRRDVFRVLDSYASLLVLLLANFFLLELVDDPRWGAVGSTLLSALALVVAISDPEAGHRLRRRHWVLIGACVVLAPLVLIVNSASIVGLTYLLPVVLLVTATLPVTVNRVLHHRRVTHETVLGALCAYVLVGLCLPSSTWPWTSSGTPRSSRNPGRMPRRSSSISASSR